MKNKRKKAKKVVADPSFTEGVQEESFKEWFISKLDNMFVDSIPMDAVRELPGRYMYIAGAITHMAAIACFVYFIYTGYDNAINTSFISLSDSEGYCESVSKQNSGTFLATETGYWDGTEGYEPALTKYRVDFFGLKATADEYKSIIREFRSEIEAVGNMAKSYDAAFNLLFWITWEWSDTNYLFQMTGNAVDIFSRYYTLGAIATMEGVCEIPRTSFLDGANNVLRLEYAYDEFIADPICRESITPSSLGYDPDYNFNVFQIELDVNALLTSLAVGWHVLDIEDLSIVPGSERKFDTQTDQLGEVVMHKYFDERWENMDLIYCFYVRGDQACVVKVNKIYMLPLLNHYGSVPNGPPKKCNCTVDFELDSYCNTIDLVIGALFYDFEEDLSLLPIFELVANHGVAYASHLAYNVTVDGMDQKIFGHEERHAAYDFCTLSFGPCNVIIFNTFDDNTHSVSEFHFQVEHPACQDTFTVSEDAWKLLEDESPVSLEESYYSCTPDVFDAMFNALGIAAGNTATMVPLLCICFLPLLYGYLQASGNVPPKAEYTKLELDAAVKALSLIMLRIRDGKLRGIKKGSVLTNLTNDLIKAAKAEGGYPDSDDDSDSDDEESVDKSAKKERRVSAIVIAHKKAPFVKSAVFLKPVSDEPDSTSGFWDSLFAPASTPAATATENPMIEMTEASKVSAVLNEGLPGADTRRRKLKQISPERFMGEVESIASAMHRAVQVQGLDGGSAAYKIAQVKTEALQMMNLDINDKEMEGGRLLMQIYNLLLLHISLEYSCSMQEAIENYSEVVAYNIGGRIYTASDMLKIKENVFAI